MFARTRPCRYLHNSPAPGLGSLATIVGLVTSGGDPSAPKAQAALATVAKTVAMHVAAAKPLYATVAEVSQVCPSDNGSWVGGDDVVRDCFLALRDCFTWCCKPHTH